MARVHACRTTPKSARKGYPHSFRIDLAGDDRGGGSSSGGKFVISAPSAEEMIQWMERIGRYSGMKESDVAAWRRQSLRLSSSSGAAPPEPEPLASPPPSPQQQQQQPQPRSRRHVGAMRCQFQPVQGLHTGEQFELHGGTAPMRLLGAESRHCEPQQDGKRSEHLQ